MLVPNPESKILVDILVDDDNDPYNEEILRGRVPLWRRLLIGVWDLIKGIFVGTFRVIFAVLFFWAT